MNIVEAFLQHVELEAFQFAGLLCSLILTPRFPASRHVVFLLLTRKRGELVMVAKVPRLPEIGDGVEREVRNLRAIQALRPQGFDSIPRVLAFEQFRGYPILVETALAGPAISSGVVRSDADRYARAVIDWLTDLHQIALPTEAWFAHFADAPLRVLEQNLPAEDLPLLAQVHDILAPLRDSQLPVVVEHGDLSHPNLIMMKSGKVGVVDWELSEVQGMVCADLFFFLSYVAFSRANANVTRDYLTPFQEAFFGPDAWTAPYIDLYLERVSIPPHLLAPLFTLTWTRYLTNLLMRLRVDDRSPADSTTLAKLRSDRYYAIWRHAVLHIGDFVLA